jgi:hypothetical protein
MKENKKLTIISRSLAYLLFSGLLVFLVFNGLAPFGSVDTQLYSGENLSRILRPSSRFTLSEGVIRQEDDSIYLTTKTPYKYDTAEIKVKFRPSKSLNKYSLGYKDETNWHFSSSVIYSELLNSLSWDRVGDGPYLYQKSKDFESIEEFNNNLPKDKVIGIYDQKAQNLLKSSFIQKYKTNSKETDTVIDTLLRGNSTFYTYLEDEPFNLLIKKQDLNWYEDQDPMKITVLKEGEIVLRATIEDDGNESADKMTGEIQEIEIKNPGPELPENGVYQIIIDASSDVVLSEVKTTLEKIVFEGPIYPASNSISYPGIVDQTRSNTIYTNASKISVYSNHELQQVISSGNNSIIIDSPNITKILEVETDKPILIPESDVVLNGIGYFAFSKENFFTPNEYKVIQVANAEDIEQSDFILTKYNYPSLSIDGWYESIRTFDIREAVYNNDNLNWMLNANGLKENSNSIEIQSIEIKYYKMGWFD